MLSGVALEVTNPADNGAGSLRQAVLAANANPGLDTIVFAIPETYADNGAYTITLASALPTILEPVIIDATTQPGFDGSPIVVLSGTDAGSGTSGLVIAAGASTVRGLVINDFGRHGIMIHTGGGNTIEGNYLGTDATGSVALGNGLDGVHLRNASGNVIGGTAPGAGNVIADNGRAGVFIVGAAANENMLQGNFIGVAADGQTGLGNGENGIEIRAAGNLIGGSQPGAGNVISDNGARGIWLVGTADNIIQGNLIGTDATGTVGLGNDSFGVHLASSAGNLVGGADPAGRNVISGNGSNGIMVVGSSATGNVIQGNYLGTDTTGTASLGNDGDGVHLSGSPGNTIRDNVISDNRRHGVWLTGSPAANNLLEGNLIGTDVSGTLALGNAIDGVHLSNAPSNSIRENLISANSRRGIWLRFSDASSNVIQGNLIGTDGSGEAVLANSIGIDIDGQGNLVGGTEPGSQNVISGNRDSGIRITPGANDNRVQGNYIGVGADGLTSLGNETGIEIRGAGNLIGGIPPGAANVVAHNRMDGILLIGGPAQANLVQGNYVGIAADGLTPLGNHRHGVLFGLAASNNRIGFDDSGDDPASANVIAYNGQAGVALLGANTLRNSIRGNSIHSNVGLGIDLGSDGVTPNDPFDADIGPNLQQNFPQILSALPGNSTIVTGTLHSTANATFTIDFYANPQPHPSGHGEGRRWLGSASVTTDAAGNADFTSVLAGATAVGQFVTATATDHQGNTSEFSAALQVPDVTPPITKILASPSPVTNAATAVFEFGAEDDISETFSFEYSLNGNDFVFLGTGPTAALELNHEADGIYELLVRATDEAGNTDPEPAAFQWVWDRTAPQLSIAGHTVSVPGEWLSFTATVDAGVSGLDAASWQWTAATGDRDGGDQATLRFRPTELGTHQIEVSVKDAAGNVGVAALTLDVQHAIERDGDLLVGGTPGDDTIRFVPAPRQGVRVVLNGMQHGPFHPTQRLVAFGLAGDDDIQVAGGLGLPAWLFGDEGNNRLKGGGGDNLLVGGPGDDLLIGGNGRNILIGGFGSNRLVGGRGDDILIAGATEFDRDYDALAAVLAEWTSPRDYLARVANLTGLHENPEFANRSNGQYYLRLNDAGATVFLDEDPTVQNMLTGAAGRDWYFFDPDRDRATDLRDEVFANDLDFVFG